MTEQEWMECEDPGEMLGLIYELASGRKLRLLSIACCRGVSSWAVHFTSELEALERFADGFITATECDKALAGLYPIVANFISAYDLLDAASSSERWKAACDGASREGIAAVGQSRLLWHYRNPQYSVYIRESFGNPFRPITLNPAWLTPTVTALAADIYDQRAFDRMPILADALEESGCDVKEVLEHCRSGGEHVRGCWVVDKVLGKE